MRSRTLGDYLCKVKLNWSEKVRRGHPGVSADASVTSARDTIFEQSRFLSSNIVSDEKVLFTLQSYFMYPERLQLTDSQVENSYIGKEFTVSEASNVTDSTHYYPICSNNSIIAILTVIVDGSELYCSVGKDFGDDLQKYIDAENPEQFVLFNKNETMYAVDSNDKIDTVLEGVQQESSINPLNDTQVTFNELKNTTDVIDSTISKQVVKISDIVPPSTYANTDYYLPRYPVVHQKNDGVEKNICWAACIASMAWYEMPNSYANLTAKNVCDTVGSAYVSAPVATILSSLQHYFKSPYVPTYESRILTDAEIQGLYANNDPAIMFNVNIATYEIAHTTTLVGYRTNGGLTAIWHMNPAGENTFSCTRDGSAFRFGAGTKRYEWYSTFRLLYNYENQYMKRMILGFILVMLLSFPFSTVFANDINDFPPAPYPPKPDPVISDKQFSDTLKSDPAFMEQVSQNLSGIVNGGLQPNTQEMPFDMDEVYIGDGFRVIELDIKTKEMTDCNMINYLVFGRETVIGKLYILSDGKSGIISQYEQDTKQIFTKLLDESKSELAIFYTKEEYSGIYAIDRENNLYTLDIGSGGPLPKVTFDEVNMGTNVISKASLKRNFTADGKVIETIDAGEPLWAAAYSIK